MKRIALALSLALTATAASAVDFGGLSLDGNIGLTNDYVFRGESQNDQNPAIQGGLDLTSDYGFYVGTWASQVDLSQDTDLEIDLYGGFVNELGNTGVSYDVGIIGYLYPGSDIDNADFMETYFGLSTDLGPVSVNGKASYSHDYFGDIDKTVYYEAGAELDTSSAFDLPINLRPFARVGHLQIVGDQENLTDYEAGVRTTVGPVDLSASWTQREDQTNLTDDRAVVSATFRF